MNGAWAARYGGLSCYTANLVAYLDAEHDGSEIVSRSVRTALTADTGSLIFSHHRTSLDRLPDGTRLRYRADPDSRAALAGVADEVCRHGRALVVVDNRRLPWSPTGPDGPGAPHWLLVDGARPDCWHVRDEFAGLLPAGEQPSFTGWLTTADLDSAMDTPPWSRQQQDRNRMAFGFPVPGADVGGRQWLERTSVRADKPRLPGRWVVNPGDALTLLGEHLAADPRTVGRYRDDCWAIAGHHGFAIQHRLAAIAGDDPDRPALERLASRWAALPKTLAFAAESATRGRPRPGLITRAFAELATGQARYEATHARQPEPHLGGKT